MASSRARFEPAPDSPIKANFAALEAIGEAMIDSGYTVMSVQSSLEDIARANGYPKTEIVVMPTALFVSVRGSGEVHTGVVSSGGRPLQLHQLDELDDLREGRVGAHFRSSYSQRADGVDGRANDERTGRFRHRHALSGDH